MTSQLETEFIVDPRIDYEKVKKNVFVVNGKQTMNYQITFNPPGFSTSPTQTIVIPSGQSLLRNCYFRMQGVISITATPAGGATNVLTPGAFGLSSNPFYRMLNTLSVTIGGYQDNITLCYKMCDILDRTRNSFWTDWSYWSGSSVLPDCCVNFQDVFNTIKNPLANYFTQGNGDLTQTRTSRISVLTNPVGAGTATLQYDLVVPVLSSVLSTRLNDRIGIARAGTLQVQLTFLTDASNMVSINPEFTTVGDGESITATMTNLQMNYQTIDTSDQNIPLQVYDSYQITYLSEDVNGGQAIAPGSNYSFTCQQRSWQTNPSVILCGTRPKRSNLNQAANSALPSWFGAPTDIQINYVKTNAFVCNFDRQLYETSLKNGVNIDYPSFQGGIYNTASSAILPIPCPTVTGGPNNGLQACTLSGSFLAFDPVRDLQTGDSYASSHGMNGSSMSSGYTWTSTYSFFNQSQTPTAFEWFIITITPMQFKEISPSQFIKTNYEIDPTTVERVIATDSMNTLAMAQAAEEGLWGGNWFTHAFRKVGHAFKHGYDGLKHAAKAVGHFAREHEGQILKGLEKFGNSALSEIPGVGPALAQAAQYAEQYGPQIKKALEKAKGLGYGYGLDEFDVAKMQGRDVCGLNPDFAREVYQHYCRSLQGGKMVSRQEIQNTIDRNTGSMRSKLRN